MVLAAPLPPSWNAHRRALRALGLEVDAVECYGLGGGLGFLYAAAPAPRCLGYGSLDPMEDSAISVGAWVDQKQSTSREVAITEMREHLARERSPVITPLRLDGAAGAMAELDPEVDAEIDAEIAGRGAAARCTFASVVELEDERVAFRAGSSDALRESSVAAFVALLLGDGRRWAVVISNGRFTAVRSRVRSALRRAVHRMTAGWRRRLGGLAALEAFCSALGSPAGLDPRPTLAASAQLGGGMGRALFAEFLDRHAEHLPAPVVRLAGHFRELDAEWREVERILAEGDRPGASLLQRIAAGEAAGTAQMREQLG